MDYGSHNIWANHVANIDFCTKVVYIYLRFKFDDENCGRHTGHILRSNSILDWASTNATSKYERAARKKLINLYLEFWALFQNNLLTRLVAIMYKYLFDISFYVVIWLSII